MDACWASWARGRPRQRHPCRTPPSPIRRPRRIGSAGADHPVSTQSNHRHECCVGHSPPAGIGVAPGRVDENSAGATVASSPVHRSDPSDSSSFSIPHPASKSSVASSELIAGTALDFEAEPTVALTIVATDRRVLRSPSISSSTVVDINEAPTALALSKTVDADVDGALVGALTASDPDVGDSLTYAVDDPRFEVVGGTLEADRRRKPAARHHGHRHRDGHRQRADSRRPRPSATPRRHPQAGAGVAASLRLLEFAAASPAPKRSTSAPTVQHLCESVRAVQNVAPPTGLDGLVDPECPAPSSRATPAFKTGASVFVEVNDADANVDPLSRETVLVSLTTGSGDVEILRPTEDGVDSGAVRRLLGFDVRRDKPRPCARRRTQRHADGKLRRRGRRQRHRAGARRASIPSAGYSSPVPVRRSAAYRSNLSIPMACPQMCSATMACLRIRRL